MWKNDELGIEGRSPFYEAKYVFRIFTHIEKRLYSLFNKLKK
jgi:hypothetical protein